MKSKYEDDMVIDCVEFTENCICFFDFSKSQPEVINQQGDKRGADDVVDIDGFVGGIWSMKDGGTFHKWKSELPISDYVEILTGAEMKSNVSANDVKQVKKKPSTREVDFTPRDADMKQTLDKWINQRAKYENSKDGQRLARYRGAVHSRIYVHLKTLMRILVLIWYISLVLLRQY